MPPFFRHENKMIINYLCSCPDFTDIVYLNVRSSQFYLSVIKLDDILNNLSCVEYLNINGDFVIKSINYVNNLPPTMRKITLCFDRSTVLSNQIDIIKNKFKLPYDCTIEFISLFEYKIKKDL